MFEELKEFVEAFRYVVNTKFPYLMPLVLSMEIKEFKSNEVIARTNGKAIEINWDVLKKLSNKEKIGIVMHEILHIANLHTIVKSNDILKNIAMDIVVNYILEQVGYDISHIGVCYKHFGLKEEDVKNKGWEEIYEMLKKNIKGEKGENSEKGKGKDEGTFDINGKSYKEEVEINEKDKQKINEKLIEGIVYAEKNRGLDALGQYLKVQIFKSKIDWRRILRQEIANVLPKDYTFEKPNRKYLQYGVYLPDVCRESEVEVNIVIDASGSIVSEKELLSKFVSEAVEIIKSFRVRGKLIVHDVDVYVDERIENLNSKKVKEIIENIKGGGGTSHKEALKRINPKSLTIFFTDGYSDLEELKLPKRSIFVVGKDYNEILNKIGKVIEI